MIPVWVWVTAAPAVLLLAVAVLLQPDMSHIHRHYIGVRATRIVRRLRAEYARTPIPTGWQSPAWTVSREAVTR